MIDMKRTLVVLFGLFLTITLSAQNKKKNYIPKSLEEAVSQLDVLFSDSTKNKINDMTEDEFLANSHFTTGRWMRNKWGLWSGKKLGEYFNNLGIYHPDDMSGIILTTYYRHLHNQDLKVEEQIEYYMEKCSM